MLLPSGKIGTNCHVVKNGARFQVGAGKMFKPATIWGGDEDKDICLLEVKGLTAKPARLGQANRLKVGWPVYAVGAPQGLELSISDGIVSQLRGGPPPVIQTTAAISRGSSGGGLFDTEGQLVGFTTLYIEGGQNLNFAMPVEWAAEIQAGIKVAQGRSAGELMSRALALESTENWAGMRDWCQQWTMEKPESGAAWVCLGFAYNKLQRYTEAILVFREALRINPQHAASWTSIALAYSSLGQKSEAIGAFQKSLLISAQDSMVWFGLGLAYNDTKRHTDAISAFREALRINPAHAASWSGLGHAYAILGRYSDAIEALNQSLRIEPQDSVTLSTLALSYAGSRNLPAALETAQRLRGIDPVEAEKVFNILVRR